MVGLEFGVGATGTHTVLANLGLSSDPRREETPVHVDDSSAYQLAFGCTHVLASGLIGFKA
jgi:hypothetical protein